MSAATQMNLDPAWMLLTLMSIPLLACMFIDQIAFMMVVIPIYAPLVKAYDLDPVWFWTLFLISFNEMLRRISLWQMGGLDGATWARVGVLAAVALPVVVGLLALAPALNALLLGESEARHLGFAVDAIKTALIGLVALGVGVSVALAGAIAFVGLVVPHIVRLCLGPDHRVVLPGSALAGAALLLTADVAARLLVAPAELPVGLLTALVGAPFFILLLRGSRDYAL